MTKSKAAVQQLSLQEAQQRAREWEDWFHARRIDPYSYVKTAETSLRRLKRFCGSRRRVVRSYQEMGSITAAQLGACLSLFDELLSAAIAPLLKSDPGGSGETISVERRDAIKSFFEDQRTKEQDNKGGEVSEATKETCREFKISRATLYRILNEDSTSIDYWVREFRRSRRESRKQEQINAQLQ